MTTDMRSMRDVDSPRRSPSFARSYVEMALQGGLPAPKLPCDGRSVRPTLGRMQIPLHVPPFREDPADVGEADHPSLRLTRQTKEFRNA